jgi:ATP-dependent protease HslVU (ClpYQ) peptidase subunit
LTIIAAKTCGDEIIIGYNDGSELGDTPVGGTSCPWIFLDDWAIGITGESSVQRLLELKLVEYSSTNSVSELIDFIYKALLENEYGSKNSSEYVYTFGIYGIIVNRQGKIWDVSGCLSLTEIPRGRMWAQGSGADYAVGAEHAISKINPKNSAKDNMLLCIEAAVENDVHCTGQPVVITW